MTKAEAQKIKDQEATYEWSEILDDGIIKMTFDFPAEDKYEHIKMTKSLFMDMAESCGFIDSYDGEYVTWTETWEAQSQDQSDIDQTEIEIKTSFKEFFKLLTDRDFKEIAIAWIEQEEKFTYSSQLTQNH